MKNSITPISSIIILLFNIIDVAHAQWINLNPPSSNYETYQSLAVSDDGKNLFSYMSDLSGNPFLVSSHDYGSTWQKYPQPKVNYNVPTAPVASVTTFWDGDVLYYVSSDMAFRKSTDFGATTSIISGTARSLSFPILRMANGNWYVGDAGYNWVSTDKGVSWTKTTGGVYGIAYVVANNGNIVALQNSTIIGYSSDGLTWSKSTVPAGITGASNTPRLSKAADGTLLAYFYSTPTSFILKSNDNGVTFQLVNSTIPVNTNIMYFFGNDIIAAEILGNTYKSTDGGLTFSIANSTKLLTIVSSMISNGNNIFLYGMSGIYRYGSYLTELSELKSDTKPAIFPNPCKSSINLESFEKYNLYKLADLTGKVVAEGAIVEKQIDLSFLKAGIYFLTVTEKNGQKSLVKVIKK